jgi:hypothetical protein
MCTITAIGVANPVAAVAILNADHAFVSVLPIPFHEKYPMSHIHKLLLGHKIAGAVAKKKSVIFFQLLSSTQFNNRVIRDYFSYLLFPFDLSPL